MTTLIPHLYIWLTETRGILLTETEKKFPLKNRNRGKIKLLVMDISTRWVICEKKARDNGDRPK